MPGLYEWVDGFTLSRPKRNIARDFADGGEMHTVLVAELLHIVYPRLVDLHNYSAQNAASGRVYNWNTLNSTAHTEKVFEKMGFTLARKSVDEVAACIPGAIEKVLQLLRQQIEELQAAGISPRADQTLPAPAKQEHARVPLGREEEPRQERDRKEEVIQELRDTIEILESKLKKSETLLRAKDARIEQLTSELQRLSSS